MLRVVPHALWAIEIGDGDMMTETETTTAMAFVETLAEYRIAMTERDAHQIMRDLGKWKEAMKWINALEAFLSFGKSLPASPSCLKRYLNGDQLAGRRDAFLPERITPPKPVAEQRSLF